MRKPFSDQLDENNTVKKNKSSIREIVRIPAHSEVGAATASRSQKSPEEENTVNCLPLASGEHNYPPPPCQPDSRNLDPIKD